MKKIILIILLSLLMILSSSLLVTADNQSGKVILGIDAQIPPLKVREERIVIFDLDDWESDTIEIRPSYETIREELVTEEAKETPEERMEVTEAMIDNVKYFSEENKVAFSVRDRTPFNYGEEPMHRAGMIDLESGEVNYLSPGEQGFGEKIASTTFRMKERNKIFMTTVGYDGEYDSLYEFVSYNIVSKRWDKIMEEESRKTIIDYIGEKRGEHVSYTNEEDKLLEALINQDVLSASATMDNILFPLASHRFFRDHFLVAENDRLYVVEIIDDYEFEVISESPKGTWPTEDLEQIGSVDVYVE